MSVSTDILRPAPRGPLAALFAWAYGQYPRVFAFLRAAWPIPHFGRTYLVTRHDDVIEVFRNDPVFAVPYKEKLDVIMGGTPFILGMNDTAEYRQDLAAMHRVVRPAEFPARIVEPARRLAEQRIAASGGTVEVVSFTRDITFAVLCDYFGIAAPPDADLRLWATRLFEFQFADQGRDPSLRAEVDRIAPALRAHVDGLIAGRRAAAAADDVLGRCLAAQLQGEPGFSDGQIRTALIGFLVGGLPQPPMAAPQAMEQLLRRPDALASARRAASETGDAALANHVFEALRFDPLAPALTRVALADGVVAAGTRRATKVPAGATVYVGLASAMRDPRRVTEPETFRAERPDCERIHFGYGLHSCFGLAINKALVPAMLRPLLRQPGLRRAAGPDGVLSKRGPFADRLAVTVSQ